MARRSGSRKAFCRDQTFRSDLQHTCDAIYMDQRAVFAPRLPSCLERCMTNERSAHRLSEFLRLTEAEIALILDAAGPPRSIARRQNIRLEGVADRSVYLLLDGWVASSMYVEGGRRQIVKLHLAGDLLGVSSSWLETSADTLEALTPVTYRRIPLQSFGDILLAAPRVGAAMFLSAQKERIAVMDRLSSVGRSTALARVASVLLDLNDRLGAIGAATKNRFELKMTQENFGDLIGLTSVHMNRTLKALEARNLIHRSGCCFTLIDQPGLRALSALPARTPAKDISWIDRSSAS